MSTGGPFALRLGAAGLMGMLMATGCPADPNAPDPHAHVVRIDDATISKDAFVRALAERGLSREPDAALREKAAHAVLDTLVTRALLAGAAQKAGLTVDDETLRRALKKARAGYDLGTFLQVLGAEKQTPATFRDGVRARLLEDRYLKSQLEGLPAPTDTAITAAYAAAMPRWTAPARVRARHILFASGEEAAFVRKQIKRNKLSFAAAARTYSKAPEGERGGDLGWFAAGDMPAVFDAAFILAPGELSPVVSSDFGFHLFELVEKRPGGVMPLEAVRPVLTHELRLAAETKARDALLAKLRQAAVVKTDDAAFDEALAWLAAEAHKPAASETNGAAPTAPDAEARANPAAPSEDVNSAPSAPVHTPNAPAARPKRSRPVARPAVQPSVPAPAPVKPAAPAPKPVATKPTPTPAKPAAPIPKPVAPKPVAPKPVAPKPVATKPAAPQKPAQAKPTPTPTASEESP